MRQRRRSAATAVPLAFELRQKIPETARDLHDLGYSFALCGEAEAALEVLDKAIELGFAAELIAIEDEFESLRGLPEFEELVGGRGQQPTPRQRSGST